MQWILLSYDFREQTWTDSFSFECLALLTPVNTFRKARSGMGGGKNISSLKIYPSECSSSYISLMASRTAVLDPLSSHCLLHICLERRDHVKHLVALEINLPSLPRRLRT